MKNEEFAARDGGVHPHARYGANRSPPDAKDYYLIFATRPAIGNFWN